MLFVRQRCRRRFATFPREEAACPDFRSERIQRSNVQRDHDLRDRKSLIANELRDRSDIQTLSRVLSTFRSFASLSACQAKS